MPYNTIILQSVIFSSFCRNEKGLKEKKNCCMKTSSNISSLSIVSKTEIFSKVEWKIARDIPRNSSYDLKNLTRTSSKQPRVKNISRGEIYIYTASGRVVTPFDRVASASMPRLQGMFRCAVNCNNAPYGWSLPLSPFSGPDGFGYRGVS